MASYRVRYDTERKTYTPQIWRWYCPFWESICHESLLCRSELEFDHEALAWAAITVHIQLNTPRSKTRYTYIYPEKF